MDLNSHNDYTSLFAQRQEQLFIEYVRKSIDLDVRLHVVSKANDELEKQLKDLRDLFEQATSSLQNLTVENKNFKSQIEILQPECSKLTVERNQLLKELGEFKLKYQQLEKNGADQVNEMNLLFKENQDLKTKLGAKTINKKRVDNSPDETNSADPNIF